MGKAKISLTREELIEAFKLWYTDYSVDPSKFQDYDTQVINVSDYSQGSSDVLIKYINIVQKGE